MKLRVGLVGLGHAWETRHRPALRALGDRFEVRAVCEQVAHLAHQAAREFNAAPLDGFRSLASRDDIDAIIMLSGQWFGALPIYAACETGKAVYCAANLAMDPEQARQLSSRVEAAGIAFMAELPRRLAPATLRLKELIATRLGAPRLLFATRASPLKTPAAQRRSGIQAIDSTFADMIELVDWCRYVVGKDPTSVLGLSHAAVPGAAEHDYQMMSLDFSQEGGPGNGPVAQISCGRYMPAAWHEAVAFRPPAALQVACENGIAFIDLPSSLTWFDRAGRNTESLDSERPVGEVLLSQFHRAVTSLVRNTSSLDDVYRALDVVLKARVGHAEGRRMML